MVIVAIIFTTWKLIMVLKKHCFLSLLQLWWCFYSQLVNFGPPNLEMQPLRTIRNTPQLLRACLNLSCSCDLDSNLEFTSNFVFFVNISEISLNQMSESTTLPFRTSEMLLTNWISKYPKLQLKFGIKKSQAYLGASLGNFFFQKSVSQKNIYMYILITHKWIEVWGEHRFGMLERPFHH